MKNKQSYSRLENLDHNLALGIRIELQDLDLLETHRFSNHRGYAMTSTNGKSVYLHRMVHSRMTGRPLREYTHKDHVRHIDPNRLDCRRSNLCVKTDATANQCDLNVKTRVDNTSGVHGVSWFKRDENWRVKLRYLDRDIFLGRYDTLEQAARVARHCQVVRETITSSDTPMDYATMKARLQSETKTISSTPVGTP